MLLSNRQSSFPEERTFKGFLKVVLTAIYLNSSGWVTSDLDAGQFFNSLKPNSAIVLVPSDNLKYAPRWEGTTFIRRGPLNIFCAISPLHASTSTSSQLHHNRRSRQSSFLQLSQGRWEILLPQIKPGNLTHTIIHKQPPLNKLYTYQDASHRLK